MLHLFLFLLVVLLVVLAYCGIEPSMAQHGLIWRGGGRTLICVLLVTIDCCIVILGHALRGSFMAIIASVSLRCLMIVKASRWLLRCFRIFDILRSFGANFGHFLYLSRGLCAGWILDLYLV